MSKDFVNLLERPVNAGVGDFSQAKKESELIEVEETKMRVPSLEALIKAKRAMNRPRDKEAISQLEAVKELRKG